jgi:glycosyltransferase involved in cell wall biosynthesis
MDQFKIRFFKKYPDFNWQTYISLYEDLKKVIHNEDQAIKHYSLFGIKEKRDYKYTPSIIEEQISKNPLVLVVVPVYNGESTIEDSINSIRKQSYSNIHIIAVDDCSTDNSYLILNKLSSLYRDVDILKTPYNCGCYNAINYALFVYKFLKYDFFTIHGADDIMLPEKIELQINALNNKKYLFCSTGYIRFDTKTNSILNMNNRGHSMVVYKKRVLNELGYYDNTRFGGDSEFFDRAISLYGSGAEYNIPKKLTNAFLATNNLTKTYPINGEDRTAYIKKYNDHHNNCKLHNNYYTNNIWTEKQYLNKKIVCGMATIPERADSLKEAVESILPQVDELIIYQNGFYNRYNFLEHNKIQILSSIHTNIDQGDAGKFYHINTYNNSIYFSIDDDLIYPSNYVETLLSYLRKYSYRVIVTCHGRTLKKDAKLYTDCENFYSCLSTVNQDRSVHFGGTGVMAFDTSFVKITFNDFLAPNIADIWMGYYAQKNNIPIIVIQHKKEWIQHSTKISLENTLWEKNKKNFLLNNLIEQFNKTKNFTI